MTERPTSELARVIAASGLPVRRFARVVMARGERTLRHWLAEGPPTEIEAWAASVADVALTPDPEGGVRVTVTYRDTQPGPGRPATV